MKENVNGDRQNGQAANWKLSTNGCNWKFHWRCQLNESDNKWETREKMVKNDYLSKATVPMMAQWNETDEKREKKKRQLYWGELNRRPSAEKKIINFIAAINNEIHSPSIYLAVG